MILENEKDATATNNKTCKLKFWRCQRLPKSWPII